MRGLDPPYDIKLVFVQKILHLFLGKSTKTASTRAALFDYNIHQIVCLLECWGFSSDTTAGAYTPPSNLLAVFREAISKERGEEGEGREGVRP